MTWPSNHPIRRYVFSYLFCVLLSLALWFNRKFGRVEIDQFLYHLQLSTDNIIRADTSLIFNAIKNCLLAPLLYAPLMLYSILAIEHVLRGSRVALATIDSLFKPLGQIFAFTAALVYFVHLNFSIPDSSIEDKDWIAEHYVPPVITVPPPQKRNLVLIYAESLETSLNDLYPNDRLFEKLKFEKYNPISFKTFQQLSDTGWTIAGIVSSQCGIPLKPLGIFNENRIGSATTSFMPKAKCLGDLLKEQGYRNIFLGGADREFSGKYSFLKTHGYHEIFGRSEFLDINPRLPLNDWGINDDDLLNFAKQKYIQLKNEAQPFNLTILTLGMHFPDGYLSPSCPVIYEDYRDAIACTSNLVADFIEFVKQHEGETDTDIVIIGDHLTMKSSVAKQMEAMQQRSIFNLFITRDGDESPNREVIDHFDVFPTILTQLNFRLKDGKGGLGCSAFDQANCNSLALDPAINAKIAKRSPFYESLWYP